MSENSKFTEYMKLLNGKVHNSSEVIAWKTIAQFEKKCVNVLNYDGYLSLNDGRDEIKLKGFMSATFIRTAKVSHIKVFLGEVVRYIIENDITKN